jgi:hypothetical protein
MKAEILKLAGVKNDADFYKKFPTEKAFMAKYGKRLEKLKKAKVGDMIAGDMAPIKQAAPISYTDLQNQTQEQFTGVSTAERNRREALDSQQAIANSNSGGGGLGDLLTQYGPKLAEFASSAFGAKNGKKLKRAQDGFMGAPFKGMPSKSVSSNSGFNTDVSQNPYMSGSLIGGQKAQQSSGSWAANPYIDSPFKASQSSGSSKSGFDFMGTLKDMAPALAMQAGPIIGAFEEIEANKKKLAEKKKFGKVSDVVLQAQNTIAEPSQRRYVRSEDKLVNGMNPLGTGTNYLAARNGAEIQNTYAPNDIYTDSGYEPLNDSLPKAQGGFSMGSFDPLSGLGGSLGGKLGSATGKGSGQAGPYSKLGATAGGLALSWFPGGSFIGSTLGGWAGGYFGDSKDQNEMQGADDHISNNTLASTFGSGAKAIQGQNKGFMEDGGWVSHDWQPQVITSFGEHSMKDLLKPDPMMNTLRAGGHLSYYTPPSERAMSTERAENGTSMAMGGDLRTIWGGEAEPISYNPYLPNGGETVMFRGQSHDETNGNGQSGIGVQYGNGGMRGYAENGISSQQADVEVERNEPATVMKDGDGKDNLVVFGNMEIPGYGANEIGDPKAKGMKFKRYIADLSKQEAKNNKYMDKSLDLINSADTNDPFQQLSFNSGKAMMLGSQMNLKSIADKKKNAAAVQDAILETAEQYGMDSAKLAKQKIANFGGKFTSSPMAQNGINLNPIAENLPGSYIPDLSKQIMDAKSAAKIAEQARHANDFNIANYIPSKLFHQGVPLRDTIGTFDPVLGQYVAPELENVNVTAPRINDEPTTGNSMLQGNIFDTQKQMKAKSGFPFESILQMGLTSAAPFLRNKYNDSVSPEQFAPEMLAAALNQIEPVGAQLYNPMLTQATSISLQDQLNEVTAQTRAAERLAQGDPSALAMIASQGQQAKSKILGEQFRMNQAEKQRVSEQNAAVLNDAQMKNLALLDQQMVRQFEGRSKTKTQSIEIAKNIADKIAKKKSENLAANVYQNMYPDYNFTSSGTAYKNPFSIASFGPGMGRSSGQGMLGGMQVGNKMLMPTNYDKRGNPTNYKLIGSDDDTDKLGRNGRIVKAFKNF